MRGWEVRIFLVTNSHELSADAAAQLAICRKIELPILEIGAEKELRVALEAAADCDVVVDALFGTGLARPLEGLFARVVEGINGLPRPLRRGRPAERPRGERAAADRPARARRT